MAGGIRANLRRALQSGCKEGSGFCIRALKTGRLCYLPSGTESQRNFMPENIGFVGVGRMGANMARRLKDCGWPITAVFDVNTGAAQSLAQELGSTAASDLKAVTALADVVFTVVTDDPAMKEIYRGGLLSRAKGKLFINCATVTPAIHVWVEQKCEAKGAQSLEACMASSITQAREGSLYL